MTHDSSSGPSTAHRALSRRVRWNAVPHQADVAVASRWRWSIAGWGIHPAIAIVMGLAAVLVLVVVGALWELRQDSINAQRRALSTLATALADELDRGLQGVVVALESTRDALRAEAPALPGPTSTMLRERAELLPLVSNFWTLDRAGRVTAASSDVPPPPLDAFEPKPNTAPTDNPRSVSISRPFVAGTRDEVALLTALTDRRGQVVGWLAAGIPTREWEGAFAMARPAADAKLLVLRADDMPLAGVSSADLLHPMSRGLVARVAGVDDLVETQELRHFPLRVMVIRDGSVLLERWHTLAKLVGAGLVVTLLVLGALLAGLLRAERARQRSEAELVQSRKLEALGNLAGGVAHDFNNVLAALLGYAELAHQSAPAGSVLSSQLDRVIQAGLRGKAVVARILSFSRGSSPRAETVFAVQPLVKQVLELLESTMAPTVCVASHADATMLYIKGDPTLCFEAVMNLCTNALQAMPEGGLLDVSVDRARWDDTRHLASGPLTAGDYVKVMVSDTGVGFEMSMVERLFEPFFTTRGRQGTGLGLSVVSGVVDEAGGGIDVWSRPGRGSRFTVYLPEHPAPADAALEAVDVPLGDGQVVLVLDDDPSLVAMTEETLARLGYEPVGFTEPHAALDAIAAEPARFDAVLTDEIMPGLSGTQVACRVRELRPDLPVLLVSGFGGPDLQRRAEEAGIRRVLSKPVGRGDLSASLAAFFDSQKAEALR